MSLPPTRDKYGQCLIKCHLEKDECITMYSLGGILEEQYNCVVFCCLWILKLQLNINLHPNLNEIVGSWHYEWGRSASIRKESCDVI